jgi:hypothetical protein
MRSLLIGLAFAGAAHAAEPLSLETGGGALAAHPALYSFADVYRLTVKGPIAGLPALQGAPDAIRVAVARPHSVGPAFSVAPRPRRETWLLIIAGVAFAGWVAHRRLAHTL